MLKDVFEFLNFVTKVVDYIEKSALWNFFLAQNINDCYQADIQPT